MSRPRVLIAYTGGTVGMAKTPSGYKPVPGHLERLMSGIPELCAEDVPGYDVH